MKFKINFKNTWWVISLMCLLLLVVTLCTCSIDYLLEHPDIASDFLNETFVDKYTCQDVLMVVHISYCTFLIVGLVLCCWYGLWHLFVKRNND